MSGTDDGGSSCICIESKSFARASLEEALVDFAVWKTMYLYDIYLSSILYMNIYVIVFSIITFSNLFGKTDWITTQ